LRRLDLFPTPLWVWNLPKHEQYSDSIMEWVKENCDEEGRWQSQTNIQTLEEFEPLCSHLLKLCRKVSKQLGHDLKKYGELKISAGWVNRTTVHTYAQESHTHPNNVLSAIYYVKTPVGMGKTVFTDPRPAAGVIVPRPERNNALNGMKQVFNSNEGMLVVFPSFLPHRVSPGVEDGERITVSFNITFENSDLMALPLWGE